MFGLHADIEKVDRRDYILDLSSRPTDDTTSAGANSSEKQDPAADRPWLAVLWRCCGCYSRVYRHPSASAYSGRCPRCGKPVRIRVGQGGTACRFFEVT